MSEILGDSIVEEITDEPTDPDGAVGEEETETKTDETTPAKETVATEPKPVYIYGAERVYLRAKPKRDNRGKTQTVPAGTFLHLDSRGYGDGKDFAKVIVPNSGEVWYVMERYLIEAKQV